jgi:hypothetical protein
MRFINFSLKVFKVLKLFGYKLATIAAWATATIVITAAVAWCTVVTIASTIVAVVTAIVIATTVTTTVTTGWYAWSNKLEGFSTGETDLASYTKASNAITASGRTPCTSLV